MKSFRVVLVGCGSMAKTWLEYTISRSDTELVALVDIQAAAAETIKQAYQLSCPTYTNLETAILENRANLVLDVTIPEAHENVVLTATRLGCDVFGEKPLAASMQAAERMVQAARDHQKTYAVMQNRRYDNRIRGLKQLVSSLGRLGAVKADFFLAPHFGGFRDSMQSPLLLDMAIHTFDQARFITGADAVSVYCHEYNPVGSWYAGQAAAICIFEMSNGAVFTYNGSWCAEGHPTSWEGAWRVIGEHGTALWDGINPSSAQIVRDATQTGFSRAYTNFEPQIFELSEGHSACLAEMFEALKTGSSPQTICTDNIKSLAMVFGAIESAQKQQKITLD